MTITHRSGKVFERARVERLFWSRIRKSRGCWEWTGRVRDSNGGPRPMLRLFYKVKGVQFHVSWIAARLCWELHFGAPGKAHVLHKCDNTICVKPSHLFKGNHLANMRDCAKKGRIRNNWRPNFLTERDRENVALMYAIGLSGAEVAAMFGCDRTYVYKVAKRQALLSEAR